MRPCRAHGRTLVMHFLPHVLLLAPRVLPAQPAETLRATANALRDLPRAPRLPRTAFLENRALVAVALSPAGDAVAYLREQKDSRALWVLSASGGSPRLLVGNTQADQVMWSRDGQWLFLRASRVLSIVGVDGRAGVRVPLGGSERRRVIKLDPSQRAAVLLGERVAAGKDERWRVVRMDAHGARTTLREESRWIHDVALDAQGRVVALTRFEGAFDALYRLRADRDKADGDMADGDLHEVLRLQPMQRLDLLAVRADGSLLMKGNPGGSPDRRFRRVLRLDQNGKLETLHQDPRGEADLDELVVDPRTHEPLAASYRSTVAATYGLGKAQAIVSAIKTSLPGRDIALQAGSGPNAYWLVSERAPTLRDPRWHLYDPRSGNMRRILDDPGITAGSPDEAALARKLAIVYTASDGRRVHGFVLIPPGVDASSAPLIAQVHGGPMSHFQAGYDGTAQFLANRGYVVFQSNFRGSTGHGLGYLFAANGDYGNGRVQRDIVDGVRWLLAQGIGDQDRVGIVGHSFGGYSALLGLTYQSELFKVGVAGSPPADLGWGMRWLLETGDQGDLPDRSLKHTLAAVSLDGTDAATYARLHAPSPQVNAARMRRPLLIIAGGADRTVAIRQVLNYAATLHVAKRSVSLLVEPGGGHAPSDPVPREAYLFAMETLLQAYLGGAPPEAPGQRLRAYLRENLRLVGPEFR